MGFDRIARTGLLFSGALGLLMLEAGPVAASPLDGAAWPRTDFLRSTIDLSEIRSGGQPRDGIPPIDRPVLNSPATANLWLPPWEPVIGIVDVETGSTWDGLGRAVAGPLTGRRLTPVESGVRFAFAWLAFHPESDIHAGN